MEKIQMKTPLVEMDGDEMTRVLWRMIKDELICPFVDLKTEYYDLGLLHRNETRDQVTVDAALATRKYGVAVKCATITPNAQRMAEYPQLTEMWKSPNGTIRSILDGTVFRAPILLDTIKPVVRTWKKPITIARHAYGDVYKSVSLETDEPGECTMTFKGADGAKKMQDMMDAYRKNTPKQVGAYKVLRLRDYKNDVITDLATGETIPTGLPKSNVLYFELENDAWFCVRPSGTEPKIKFYAGIKGNSLDDSAKKLDELMEAIKNA